MSNLQPVPVRVVRRYNAKKELVYMEHLYTDTNHCFLAMHFFYDNLGRRIRETQDVNNERERSHTETLIRYEENPDVMICESVTHYEFSAWGLRDERTVDYYSGTAMLEETYDLETGELKSVQDFDPCEDFFREITYHPDGSVDVDFEDDIC